MAEIGKTSFTWIHSEKEYFDLRVVRQDLGVVVELKVYLLIKKEINCKSTNSNSTFKQQKDKQTSISSNSAMSQTFISYYHNFFEMSSQKQSSKTPSANAVERDDERCEYT